MLENKKKIIIIAVVIIIVIIALVAKNNKTEEVETGFNINSEVLEYEAVESEQIKNAFAEVEEVYESAVTSYSGYTRGDFYNETRLNEKMNYGQVSFVYEIEIPTDRLYDTSGNKLETLPSFKVNDKEVEISSSDFIEDEEYYLLRCTSNSSYTYYYIIKISSTGELSLTWYCYTENESLTDTLTTNQDNDTDIDSEEYNATEDYNDLDY
jgi:hypothetical protein